LRVTWLFWFALFIASEANSQHIGVFYNGSITLADDQVLVGKFSTNAAASFVVFQIDKEKATILAHEIKSLRYYDSISKINRQFISMKETTPFLQWRLYEVVIQGTVKVLRREKRVALTDMRHEINDYDYFTFYKEELIPLKKFRTLIYPKLIREKQMEIEQFVSLHHLNMNEMKSALLILKEYNQLQSQKKLLAKLD